MLRWARELYPLCRSLTGPGLRQTLDFIAAHLPGLTVNSFKSGDQVFDWQIPDEWTIRDAFLEHESGQRFAEFSKSNLHVLNYAAPLDTRLSRDELLPFIHTQPDQPDVIPYVTSYYSRRSGFCMSENDKRALPPGHYRAFIDSDLEPGSMEQGELFLPGSSGREILFSTYVCHPSLANNELSGPVLSMALAQYVKDRFPDRTFGYRFLFLQETIGSIAWLSRNLEQAKRNIAAGFVLSCVGDERAWSHVESRHGDSLADRALHAAIGNRPGFKRYDFLERGSDERQYCAPGIDLPVCGFCRSKYGEYPEYHTSDDDFSVVTAAGLQQSFDAMTVMIRAFEAGCFPRVTVLGEPQLGKRGLYPTISQKGRNDPVRLRMNVLAWADGSNSIFDIASRIGESLDAVVEEVELLSSHGLLADAGIK